MRTVLHFGIFIFLLFLTVACGPDSGAQPETPPPTATVLTDSLTATPLADLPGETPTATAVPQEIATTAPVALPPDQALVWQGYTEIGDGDPTRCKALWLSAEGQALFGPCEAVETASPLTANQNREWAEILTHFAPLEAHILEEQIIFKGTGEVTGPAWGRAIAAWSRFTYGELVTGGVSASARTVLSWWLGELPDRPGNCAHLVVLVYGYAYARIDPCEGGGEGEIVAEDWLTTEEWAQFDSWLYSRGELYQEQNYFSGLGSQAMTEAEVAELAQQAEAAYTRLAGLALAPEEAATPPDTTAGLCPEAPRPALVVMPPSLERIATVIDLNGQVYCELTLQAAPHKQLVSAAGSLFYDVFDEAAQTTTVWRLNPDGTNQPLPFTTINMAQGDLLTFLVSPDGSKVVWGTVRFNPDTQVFESSLWAANLDGLSQVTLLDGVKSGELGQPRYPEPIHFSRDNQTLFYALQPDWLPPVWSVVNGHYNNIFSISLSGGEPSLLFECPAEGPLLCIGDVSAEGLLAYTDQTEGVVKVLGPAGETVNTFTPPATAYIGPAIFNASGQLAFSSATLQSGTDFPLPEMGSISLVSNPYAGEPKILLSREDITVTVRWVGDDYLVVFYVKSPQEDGMALVSLEGQFQPIPVSLNSLASFITVLP
jgi:hypothetical protein